RRPCTQSVCWRALPPALTEALAGRVPEVAWHPLAPGLDEYRFEGVAPGELLLVRGAPGRRVPAHRHRGQEAVLVLQGAMDDGGVVLRAGDFVLNDEEAHAPEILGDEPCVCLILLTAPIEFTEAG
ncbi:MAG: cupin domain-containing protein, partial [Amaricoccus sp.]|uniref:cupin domain-containing protein n=1 Tax=Amaricoccus sp. TaxID=1872485 RepID=UPI003314AFD4